MMLVEYARNVMNLKDAHSAEIDPETKNPVIDILPENKETEKENLLEAKKNKFLHSYMVRLREEMGVKITYELFLKINSDVLSKFGGEE